MPHYGDPCSKDSFYGVYYFLPSLDFHCMTAGLLHYSDSALQCKLRIALIAAEWHIHDYQGSVHGIHDALSVVDHVFQSYGDRSVISRHHV